MPKKTTTTRPERPKLKVCRELPANLRFGDLVIGRASVYAKAINEAISCGGALEVAAGDSYMLHQLRQAAKKLNVQLTYATTDSSVWVKPMAATEEEKRLLAWLRVPRTENELLTIRQEHKIEIDLKSTLERFERAGTIRRVNGKWQQTVAEAKA